MDATVAEGSTGISLYHTGVAVSVDCVRDIANLLKHSWEGDGEPGNHRASRRSNRPARMRSAFVGNRKAAAAAAAIRSAGCLLVTEDFPAGRTLIRVRRSSRRLRRAYRTALSSAARNPGYSPHGRRRPGRRNPRIGLHWPPRRPSAQQRASASAPASAQAAAIGADVSHRIRLPSPRQRHHLLTT